MISKAKKILQGGRSMESKKRKLCKGGFNLQTLQELAQKPKVFAPGERLFWNDPHISKQMLEAHLHPEWDAASRNHQTIEKTVHWLVQHLHLKQGMKVLDLGCGPGLYCSQFCQYGLEVTGIDYSKRSIEYAEVYARENDLKINYLYQNYLDMDYTEEFDAIFLIYYDFEVLAEQQGEFFLQKIYQALKPGGYFVMDITTELMRKGTEGTKNWELVENGFWKPNPYLSLYERFHYPEEKVYLDQHIVFEDHSEVSIYRIWARYFSPQSIGELFVNHGFLVKEIWGNLMGSPLEENSKEMGVIVMK